MVKGYYYLASDMLTQSRSLNVISNNIANLGTPGYKRDTYIANNFQQELLSRIGNQSNTNATPLGNVSMMRAGEATVTDYKEGPYEETGRTLDFAIKGNGFFHIQTMNGENYYTRNGSFTRDDQGYLFLQNVGRVMGKNGQPIHLGANKLEVKDNGDIYGTAGQLISTMNVVDFPDYTQLTKAGEGMFAPVDGGPGQPAENYIVAWKGLEASNSQPSVEMTSMLHTQRALQSASEVIKMYDQLLAKATTEIGRM